MVQMLELDCFLRCRIGYGTLQPFLGCQRVVLLRGIFHVKFHIAAQLAGTDIGILHGENPTYMYWRRAARASRGFKMVKWFYSLSRQKTFVGGKCALPSAFLVILCNSLFSCSMREMILCLIHCIHWFIIGHF